MLLLFLAAATVPITWYYIFIRKPLNHTDEPSADGEIKIIFLAVRQSCRVAGLFDLHKYSLHTLHARELFERLKTI